MDNKKCYLNEDFLVQCNDYVPYWGDSDIIISKIMLLEGQMHLPNFVGRDCYNQSGDFVGNGSRSPALWLRNFSVSNTKNKFVAIGCDTMASIRVKPNSSVSIGSTGCITQCPNIDDVPNGTCSGMGCCNTTIPSEVGYFRIYFDSFNSNRDVWSFNNCSYAFIMEEGAFNFSKNYLQNLKKKEMPVMVDWIVNNKTCLEAQSDVASYACENNAVCEEPNGNGYVCKCVKGYNRNPYLSDGCQDVNECEDQSLNTCKHNSKCYNTPGDFIALPPKDTMKEHKSPMGSKEKLLLLVAVALPFAAIAAPPTNASLAECKDHCGNVSIPYPFGMEKGCYLNEDFLVQCNDSVPYLRDTNIIFWKIMPSEGQMRLPMFVARDCYNQSGYLLKNSSCSVSLELGSFSVSNTKNKFVAIGCDTFAAVRVDVPGLNGNVTTGCNTQCTNIEDIPNGNCSGIGCCETTIPSEVGYYRIDLESFNNHEDVWSFNNCSYAFIVEEGKFNFSKSYLKNFIEESMPVVVDWTVNNKTCQEAQSDNASYACGDHARCEHTGKGYTCKCIEGYNGNPYLLDGCQDVNECEDRSLNTCKKNSKCYNTMGNFTCVCHKGYHGDGKTGCTAKRSKDIEIVIADIMIQSAGVFIGTTTIFMITSWLYWIFRKRQYIKLKEKFFKQNGGLMLQQLLHKQERSNQEVTRIFTFEELQQATNNYDSKTIVGRGGNGTVYKGILPNNNVVAIKKSNKMVDESQVEQFINELVVLSQINHRNVVKLLGCCLEAQVPLLVYEFISHGTLFEHLHKQTGTLPWETRLQIAAETAGVLSYLHSTAAVPIIHRDVKSTNILLDDNYTAKVSDFGASKLIPQDEDQLATAVQGTLGYLDPEYLHTSNLTQKSDVYSFGVVLVELITGMKALSFDRPEEERSLANYFISCLVNNRLDRVIDKHLVIDGNDDQLKEVAYLAMSCLKMKGDERPSMKEVAMDLEGIIKKRTKKHSWSGINLSNTEETECLLGEESKTLEIENHTNQTTLYDSVREHVLLPVDGGR
ncbi:Non-specific serine/threonine protein kinase [Bertholletia excelsa]